MLRGTEVKSVREGHATLGDAYVLVRDGEAFLLNAHISPYTHGNIFNHEPTRTRKLLLHKREFAQLDTAARIKGFTLIPARLYFLRGRLKCEVAVAKGKQTWDKRATERRREANRLRAQPSRRAGQPSPFLQSCGTGAAGSRNDSMGMPIPFLVVRCNGIRQWDLKPADEPAEGQADEHQRRLRRRAMVVPEDDSVLHRPQLEDASA